MAVPVGHPPEVSHRREAFSMLRVRNEIREKEQLGHPHEGPHKNKALPVHKVWCDLQTQEQLEHAHESPHRSETVRVPGVRQGFCGKKSGEKAQLDSHHGREETRVWTVREEILTQA